MKIKISNKHVGDGESIFFIAEAGVNHNGSLENAIKLIDIAYEAGADAVKFQTFKAENLNTLNAPKSNYHIETTGNDNTQTWYELLKSQELTIDMHEQLIKYCIKKNIIFLSTPYDEESVDLLYKLEVPAFKIASTDTNNIPFLSYIAKNNRPIILSTAMSNIDEVEIAINAIRKEKCNDIVLLQCTGNYPSKISDSNLKVMNIYRKKFNCLVGYSDHTLENINPIAATAMGACVYEKHFTIDKDMYGPDHRMSLNPSELKETIKLIRDTEISLGSENKIVNTDEIDNRIKLRKSLVANIDIEKDMIITEEMITAKRPGNGIKPNELNNIINRISNTNIRKDTVLTYDMFRKKNNNG